MEQNAASSVQKMRPSTKRPRAEKKDHTVNNNLSIDIAERFVRYRSRILAGRVHATRIGDEADYTFPPGDVLLNDTGVQGCEPAPVWTYQPKKKPRGQERSPDDKAETKMSARSRLLVEHVMAGVKRCRIGHDILRNTTAHFDDLVMEIAGG